MCRCCLDPTYVNKAVILKSLLRDWTKQEEEIHELRQKGEEVADQVHGQSDLPRVATAIHVANWIKLSFASILLVGFTILSMTVSRTNIEIATLVDQGEAKQKDDTKVLADQALALQKVDQRYDEQIADLQASYQRDTAAIGAAYIGEIKRQRGKAQEYTERGQRDGKNYGTAIARTDQAIGKVLSKKGPKINQRSKELGEDLAALNVQREADRKRAAKPYDIKLKAIYDYNDRMSRLKARQNAWMSGFLKNYAQFATIGQLIAWIWITLSRFTSGIEPAPRVKPEMVSTTLFQDLYTLLTVGPSRSIHNLVRKQLSKIKLLRPMPYRGADYDFSTLRAIQTIQEKMEKTNSLEMLRSEIESIKKGYQREVTTRRKGGIFSFLRRFSTPAKSVETKGVESVENGSVESVETKGRKGVEKPKAGKRRKSTQRGDSTLSTDDMETYQGLESTVRVEGKEIPIRLLVMGAEVFADWYGTPRGEQWVSKARSNYQRFLDNGERDTSNTREKIAVALGFLQSFFYKVVRS